MQGSHCTTRPGGDTTATSASLADLVIQLKQNRKTQSTAALPTEAVNKVLPNYFQPALISDDKLVHMIKSDRSDLI